jgi:hypothetical protein
LPSAPPGGGLPAGGHRRDRGWPDSRRLPSQSLTATPSAPHDWMSCRQQDASNQCTVRMGREVQAEPEVGWQAEAPDEIEMELQ